MAKIVHDQNVSCVCFCAVLLVLAQFTDYALANYEHTCDFQSRPHPRGFCGSALSDIIHNVCTSATARLLNRYMSKRDADTAPGERMRKIILNKKEAFSYLSKRETRGSIVCECCHNSCLISEMLQYCNIHAYLSRRVRN